MRKNFGWKWCKIQIIRVIQCQVHWGKTMFMSVYHVYENVYHVYEKDHVYKIIGNESGLREQRQLTCYSNLIKHGNMWRWPCDPRVLDIIDGVSIGNGMMPPEPTHATTTQPLLFSSLLLLSPPPPHPSLPVPCLLNLTPPKRPSNARSSPLETHGTIDQTLPPE